MSFKNCFKRRPEDDERLIKQSTERPDNELSNVKKRFLR